MHKLLAGFTLTLVLWMSVASGPVGAADKLPEADTQAAQTVVRAQLAAMAADDAERAFSFASNSIRSMFGTAERFMAMVRGSYPVVYRPRSVVFLQPEADGEAALLQPVHMTDQSGVTWLAVYSLQRQADNSWRIAGCVLLPATGKTA